MVRRLLLLNGLSIICVVSNHAVGIGLVALFWWTDRYRPVVVPNFDALGGVNYNLLRLIEGLVAFAIPAFLLVSGYFAAVALARTTSRAPQQPGLPAPSARLGVTAGARGQSSDAGPWPVVTHRIRGLVIPYLIWSVVYLALEYILGDTYGPASYLRRLLLGGASQGFYYIPLLCQLYLLAPLLVEAAKRRPRAVLLITAGIQLAAVIANYASALSRGEPVGRGVSLLATGWFFPGHIFWFALGVVAGCHVNAFKNWLAHAAKPALLLAPVLLVLSLLEWEALQRAFGQPLLGQYRTLSDELYSAAILTAFLGGGALAPRLERWLQALGVRSFGIYLAHGLGLILAAKVIYRVAPQILPHQLVLQSVLLAAALAVPLLLMAAVNRSPMRRFYKVLFG